MIPPDVPDHHRIQGTWRAVEIETLGYRTDDLGDERLLIFTGDRARMHGGPTYRFRLDPAKDPKELDFLDADTGNAQFHGIYKFEGDRLVTCVTTHLLPRTQRFTTTKGTSDLLTYYERVGRSPEDSGSADAGAAADRGGH